MPWITGRHGIVSALDRKNRGKLYLVRDSRNEDLAERAKRTGIPVVWTSHREIRNLCGSSRVRGAAFLLDEASARSEGIQKNLSAFLEETKENERSLVLVLDHVKDPHNLGAIMRSADMFRADLLILPERRSVQVSDTVARTSAGAVSYVPVAVESNLSRAIDALKDGGYWIYAADMSGTSSYRNDFAEKTALIVGSEGKGVSSLIKKKSDLLVGIPTEGHLDSLNVSVSTAILLYEYRRRFSF